MYTSMHRLFLNTLCFPLLLLLGMLPSLAFSATTAPRFTGKENALRLAETLDKGVFQQKVIQATFVESNSPGRYQVRLLLSNGAELHWDLHQVRAWAQTDRLILAGNRSLIFPSEGDNRFVVLDKTRFSDAALKAKIFVKHYEDEDLLAGQEIHYTTLRFHLTKLLDIPTTRDAHGYQHVYAFDFTNGQRELLSARQAYFALEQRAFLQDRKKNSPFIQRPYILRRMRPKRLIRPAKGGFGRFSLELEFDQPVTLSPGHYPFQVYEQEGDERFLIQFLIPNAIIRKPIRKLPYLEFLRNIQALPSATTPGNALVRAFIASNVLNTPPEVIIDGNKVNLTFTKIDDQSMFNPHALREAKARRQQELALTPALSTAQIKRRQEYRQLYTLGLRQVGSAQASGNVAKALGLQAQALVNFQKAAEKASSDDELESALLQRNVLLKTTPYQIASYVERSLGKGRPANRQALVKLLDMAVNMSDDIRLLRRLNRLFNKMEKRR